jgi:hypothetical protein
MKLPRQCSVTVTMPEILTRGRALLGDCVPLQNQVTWQSMKQKVVVQLSCEDKYIAAANATCQALWLNRVLADMQGATPGVPLLKVDNKLAIALIKNPVLSG